MGILLGLVTALTWGGADFVARSSTHRIGTLRTMFYMQFTGFLLLTLSLRWLGGWGHLADGSGWQPWAWGFWRVFSTRAARFPCTVRLKSGRWLSSRLFPRVIPR